MNITELFTAILALMGFVTLRFGVPLLMMWLLKLALLKLVPTPN
jgi:hypothetical protein